MSIRHDGSNEHARTALKDTASPPAQNADSGLEPTEIHDLLSNQRRHYVIKYLVENEPAELRELAEYVASQIENQPITSTDDQYDTYRVSLHQTHLDALADANVIKFERKADQIHLDSNAEQVIEFMPDVSQDSDWAARMKQLTNLFP